MLIVAVYFAASVAVLVAAFDVAFVSRSVAAVVVVVVASAFAPPLFTTVVVVVVSEVALSAVGDRVGLSTSVRSSPPSRPFASLLLLLPLLLLLSLTVKCCRTLLTCGPRHHTFSRRVGGLPPLPTSFSRCTSTY